MDSYIILLKGLKPLIILMYYSLQAHQYSVIYLNVTLYPEN